MWKGYSFSTVLHVVVVLLVLLGLPSLPAIFFEEFLDKVAESLPPLSSTGVRHGEADQAGQLPSRVEGESVGSVESSGVGIEFGPDPGNSASELAAIPVQVLVLPEAPDTGGRKTLATAPQQFSPVSPTIDTPAPEGAPQARRSPAAATDTSTPDAPRQREGPAIAGGIQPTEKSAPADVIALVRPPEAGTRATAPPAGGSQHVETARRPTSQAGKQDGAGRRSAPVPLSSPPARSAAKSGKIVAGSRLADTPASSPGVPLGGGGNLGSGTDGPASAGRSVAVAIAVGSAQMAKRTPHQGTADRSEVEQLLRFMERTNPRLAGVVNPPAAIDSAAAAARAAMTMRRTMRAADQGRPNAQFNVGRMLLWGRGAARDAKQAMAWFKRAAERDYVPAQMLLSHMATAGTMGPRDLARSDFWLSLAERRGSKPAKQARGMLREFMRADDINRSRRMRSQWKRVMSALGGPAGDTKDIDVLNEELREAAEAGDVDGLMSALQEGADADNKGAGGRNAIINAAWRGRDHILEIMLENGADIDVADDLGRTPLIWGAINGHRSVVSALLKNGTDPDKRDGEGVTALMRAAWNGHTDVIDKLLQAGARTDLKDAAGRTALDHARREGNKKVIGRLLAATR